MLNTMKDFYSENSAITTAASLLVGVGVCGVSSYWLLNKVKDVKERRRLRQLILRKQKERTAAFDKLRRTYELNGDRNGIVQLKVEDLLQKLQTRELSAIQVLEAYIAKALQATDAFNCVTEFVPQAFAWAQSLDQSPHPLGPLHGLPVAIKDDTDIEGMDSTLGFASNLFKLATKSSVFVQSMRQLGAVPFCKTNTPQSLMSYGSDNPIWGATTNPLNRRLGPGGSSSGSGCIIGAGAAPVAEGTDLGGSVRIPAHFCGAAGIRPTIGRISGKGVGQAVPDIMGLTGVAGLIAKEAKTVATVFQGLTFNGLQNSLDPLAHPIPWNEEIYSSTRQLRIGYFTSVPIFPAMGDTPSTVLSAKKALESLGHTLIPFKLPDSYNYAKVMVQLALADDAKYVLGRLKNEPPSVAMAPALQGLQMSPCMRKLLGFLSGCRWLPFMYSKRVQHFIAGGGSVEKSWQLWEAYGKRREILEEILEQMESQNLDLILGPVFPFPAIRAEYSGQLLHVAFAYSSLWNVVDFPAGVVTFGKESGTKLDQFDNEGDGMLKTMQEAVKDSAGMPIAVTLVGKPYQEELVLRAMVELEARRPSDI